MRLRDPPSENRLLSVEDGSDFERGFQYLYETSPESIAWLVLDRPSRVLTRESTGLPEKPGRLDTLLRVRLAGERHSRRLIVDFKDRWRGEETAAQLAGYASAIKERHREWPMAAVLSVVGPRRDDGWSPPGPIDNPGLRLGFQCRLTCLRHLEASWFIEHAPPPALMLAGATQGITPALMQRAFGIILQWVANREVRENLIHHASIFCTGLDHPERLQIRMEGGMKSPFGELLRKHHKEGLEKGLKKGQVDLLLCQIRDRFGRVPARTATWLAGLTGPQLRRVARKVLTARSLADLGPPGRRNGAAR